MGVREDSERRESYDASFRRKAISDDPSLQDGRFVGQEFPLSVKLTVHPSDNGIIVINYPGALGDIDGYNNKYATLGNHVQQNVGAVIRTDNPVYAGFKYDVSVREHLKVVIDYALKNAVEISGVKTDDVVIYLVGFSAGSSAIAAVAHEYPQVKKILLMAPSGDAGQEAITEGLRKYTGECHIVIGENDEVVGKDAGSFFASLATGASVVRSVVIPNCDHQFRGERNGRIMSAAPLWAFSDPDSENPSPEKGVKLYD
ncbi:MAG: hypothetical protein UT36_C0002G0005 [Candidatus Peregrinibacteria bacterium GW2011_GWF2_39_17]|nr:MAG: hypothetical protein UT36_C0002G0005 [Candidatus Peregrinibacteria bacterium GW2011_GWF2_39_17]HCW32109.1 hypothetical protein [Candidatus Peregrinibacteria bacterium]